MNAILTQAFNDSTSCWETIEREPCTQFDFEIAELSASDLGCPSGTIHRLVLVDELGREIHSREIAAT